MRRTDLCVLVPSFVLFLAGCSLNPAAADDVKPVAPPRRPAIAVQPANHPIQREVHRSPTGRVYDFTRDPAKMDDEELAAAIAHFKGRIAAEEANGIAAETLNSTAAETLNGTAAETLNGKESPHTP